MAGITAYFGTVRGTAGAMAAGLTARGDELVRWSAGAGDTRLELALRAAIPQIHTDPGGAAVAVDGVAEASTILSGYRRRGGAGTLDGRLGVHAAPYALVLADPHRAVLVLARHGDGPPLYYARHRGAVLVGSEPPALLDGGCPAAPDPTTITRFLDTGRCDTDGRTFYAGIRRVLPGQVLEVRADGIRPVPAPVPAAAPADPPATATALCLAAADGRVGVRLDGELTGAALLAASLLAAAGTAPTGPAAARPPQACPLPVYGGPAGQDPPPGRPTGAVRHRGLSIGTADVERALADLGEPVAEPDAVRAWRAAAEATGEVDALLDPVGAAALLAGDPVPGHLSRLADRVATRFGVELRTAYRAVPDAGPALRRELAALCRRGLPGGDAGPAAGRVPAESTRDLLWRLRGDVYATFLSASFARRPWHDERAVVAGLGELLRQPAASVRPEAAARYWRLFVTERWLRWLERRSRPERTAPAPEAGPAALPVTVDGMRWLRWPVATSPLRSGDRFADVVSWYVAERLRAVTADDRYRRRLRRSWYLVVAAAPLAVAQGRLRPLWQVRPGWWARRLSGAVRDRSWQGPGSPWTMQVAIDEAGLGRLLLAAAAGAGGRLARRRGLFDRVAGASVRALCGPREHALYPANVSVAAAPARPARALADVLAATRAGLHDEVAAGLAGGAVLATDRVRGGCRVLACVGDRPAAFYVAACADDPLGTGDTGTPAAVLALAPPTTGDRPTHAHLAGTG